MQDALDQQRLERAVEELELKDKRFKRAPNFDAAARAFISPIFGEMRASGFMSSAMCE